MCKGRVLGDAAFVFEVSPMDFSCIQRRMSYPTNSRSHPSVRAFPIALANFERLG